MKNLQYYIVKSPIIIRIQVDNEWLPYIIIIHNDTMAQMPALIPKEVEIQRLKKIWMIIISMGLLSETKKYYFTTIFGLDLI